MSVRLSPELEALYPNLNPQTYHVTSNKNKKYNCVAWAAKRDENVWWEPLEEPGCYWPADVPLDHGFQNYIRVFELLGYQSCPDASREEGFEKVAIFRDHHGWFSHVANQLEDGTWTSKLGSDEDIRHDTVQALEGIEYGVAEVFMKRLRLPKI